MNERELLSTVADGLGIDPAHPDRDQMDAATASILGVAQKLARMGVTLLRLADEGTPAPPAVLAWLATVFSQFDADGRVCNAQHVASRATPTLMLGSRPNIRYCIPCGDYIAQRLAAKAQHGSAWDCDFCGVPTDLFRLRPVVIPVLSILVRGLGCVDCVVQEGEGS